MASIFSTTSASHPRSLLEDTHAVPINCRLQSHLARWLAHEIDRLPQNLLDPLHHANKIEGGKMGILSKSSRKIDI